MSVDTKCAIPNHVSDEAILMAICHVIEMPFFLNKIGPQDLGFLGLLNSIENEKPTPVKNHPDLNENLPSSVSNPWERWFYTENNKGDFLSALIPIDSNMNSFSFRQYRLEPKWKDTMSFYIASYSSDAYRLDDTSPYNDNECGFKLLSSNLGGDRILVYKKLIQYFGGKLVYSDGSSNDYDDPNEEVMPEDAIFRPLLRGENELEWRCRVQNEIASIPLLTHDFSAEIKKEYELNRGLLRHLDQRQEYLDRVELEKDLAASILKPTKKLPSLSPGRF